MKNFNVIISMLILVFLSGCATTDYWVDRKRDALDIITLTQGTGFGLFKARVGPIDMSGLWDCETTNLGIRGGEFVGGEEKEYDFIVASGDHDISLIWGYEEFDFGNFSLRQKNFISRNIRFNENSFGSKLFPWGIPFVRHTESKCPYYYTQIEAGVGFFLSFRAGINPGEIVDFVSGIFKIDIFDDDIGVIDLDNNDEE